MPPSLDPVILTRASYPVLPGETAAVSGANYLDDALDPDDASVTILPPLPKSLADGFQKVQAQGQVSFPPKISPSVPLSFTLPPTLPLNCVRSVRGRIGADRAERSRFSCGG
mmetsp:Transcript_13060/g.38393  ORF Transcript_13060/g.38393 Transcript_13060/m.38393 type:complete len:112 (-) Transcript_13060:521-856(-)